MASLRTRDSENVSAVDGHIDSDRGQMFLILAVSIAALLVALSVVLNSAMYAGNIATRGDNHDTDGAADYQTRSVEEARRLMGYTNTHNNSNYGSLRSGIRASISEWSDTAGNHAITEATGAHISVKSTNNGTLVYQNNDSRKFTNVAGVSSWELVPGTSNIRQTNLNVSRPSLVDPGGNDSTVSDLVNESVFAVKFDDGGGEWRVFVYQDGVDEVVVKIADDTGGLSPACQATAGSNGYAKINISNGSVGGQPCSHLDFIGGLSGSFDIHFERGHNAVGQYEIVAEQKIGTVDDGDFAPVGSSDNPLVNHILYSVHVDVIYVTPTLQYETKIRLAPGESYD